MPILSSPECLLIDINSQYTISGSPEPPVAPEITSSVGSDDSQSSPGGTTSPQGK